MASANAWSSLNRAVNPISGWKCPLSLSNNLKRSACVPNIRTHTPRTSKMNHSLTCEMARDNFRDCLLQIKLFAIIQKLKWSPQPPQFENLSKTTVWETSTSVSWNVRIAVDHTRSNFTQSFISSSFSKINYFNSYTKKKKKLGQYGEVG